MSDFSRTNRQRRIIGFAPWVRPIDDARLDDESFDGQAARLLSVVLLDDGGLDDREDANGVSEGRESTS